MALKSTTDYCCMSREIRFLLLRRINLVCTGADSEPLRRRVHIISRTVV